MNWMYLYLEKVDSKKDIFPNFKSLSIVLLKDKFKCLAW